MLVENLECGRSILSELERFSSLPNLEEVDELGAEWIVDRKENFLRVLQRGDELEISRLAGGIIYDISDDFFASIFPTILISMLRLMTLHGQVGLCAVLESSLFSFTFGSLWISEELGKRRINCLKRHYSDPEFKTLMTAISFLPGLETSLADRDESYLDDVLEFLDRYRSV